MSILGTGGSSWLNLIQDDITSVILTGGASRTPMIRSAVRAAVGEERFVREAGDPLLRARLFLQMISGNDLIPVTEDWELEVRQAL